MEEVVVAVPQETGHECDWLPNPASDLLKSEQSNKVSITKPNMIMTTDSVTSPDLAESKETVGGI